MDRAHAIHPAFHCGRAEWVLKSAVGIGQNLLGALEPVSCDHHLERCSGKGKAGPALDRMSRNNNLPVARRDCRIHVRDLTIVGGVGKGYPLSGCRSFHADLVGLALVKMDPCQRQSQKCLFRCLQRDGQVYRGRGESLPRRDASDARAVGQGHDLSSQMLLVGYRSESIAIAILEFEKDFV